MTEKEFLNTVVDDTSDVIQQLLNLLDENNVKYCVIGGLAVNAYVEPVVSLDLDIVIAAGEIEKLILAAKTLFKIKEFEHSLNLKSPNSNLRIQIQIDNRYQDFIPRAQTKKVLGYDMKVAALKDVLQGKIWAYSDTQRRKSKRQKDLADIFRLVEEYPELKHNLPNSILEILE